MEKNFPDVIHTYEENVTPNRKWVITEHLEIIDPNIEEIREAEKNILDLTKEILKNPKDHRNSFEWNKYI